MSTRIAALLRRAPLPVAALLLMLPAGPVRTDAIDGHWCASDGRHLSIKTGDQHAGRQTDARRPSPAFLQLLFSAAEPHAGAVMAMWLIRGGEVHLKVQIDAAKTEIWRRCDFTSWELAQAPARWVRSIFPSPVALRRNVASNGMVARPHDRWH